MTIGVTAWWLALGLTLGSTLSLELELETVPRPLPNPSPLVRPIWVWTEVGSATATDDSRWGALLFYINLFYISLSLMIDATVFIPIGYIGLFVVVRIDAVSLA